MIDTHCHLFRSYYEDLDNLIVKLKENNIYCIVNGCEYFSNIESVELSNNDNIYAAVGYQPTELDNIGDDYIEVLEGMLDNNKVVAIGEIGLDYYWNKDNRNIQIEVFKKQLELASKYNLPVIIHSRDAVGDVYNILKEYKEKYPNKNFVSIPNFLDSLWYRIEGELNRNGYNAAKKYVEEAELIELK